MKKLGLSILLPLLALPFAASAGGCSSDDSSVPLPQDGGNVRDTGTGTPQDSGTKLDGGSCTAAKETLLKPIDSVSEGEVAVLPSVGLSKTIYVDASAGGIANAAKNPRVYVNLETAAKVSVTDRSAETSSAWDLALKRDILFVNNGDGGPANGSALFLEGKGFDDVTAADAQGKDFPKESFFDLECKAKLDERQALKTTFSGWYVYDEATHQITGPKPGVFLVKTAGAKLFKVQILSYKTQKPDAGAAASAQYSLKVQAL
ncbi:HmuY family protein [Pendulispora albinea]|uniref:HmuY family protein n=1 Tax=Pendulispora albinea TaxID=2741071 RepID=A0ABZ2M1I9_9BACT